LGSKGLWGISYEKFFQISKKPLFLHFVWEIVKALVKTITLNINFALDFPFKMKMNHKLEINLKKLSNRIICGNANTLLLILE
jgi:hypothetical protein